MKVPHTLALTALIAGCATPALAQIGPATPMAQAEPAPNLRSQVRTMETVLVSGVQNGVDRLAQKINEVAPGLQLFAGLPHAHGYQLQDIGWFFDVEVPDIYPGTAALYSTLLPTDRKTTSGQVNASVTQTQPDTPEPAVVRDPQGEYRMAIREALIDAMVDFGQMPLKANESLTVGARRPDLPGQGSVGDSVALVLSIKGEDLALYRQGKITREEAKAKIRIREDHR